MITGMSTFGIVEHAQDFAHFPQLVCYDLPTMQTFGARIRALRAGFGLTQAEAGARLGISANTLRAWEQDRDPGPTLHQIDRIASVFNVSAFWLYAGKGAPKR